MTIKKYKPKWSIWAFKRTIPKQIQDVQGYLKSIILPSAITTWLAANAEVALIITGTWLVIDILLHFTYLEEIK